MGQGVRAARAGTDDLSCLLVWAYVDFEKNKELPQDGVGILPIYSIMGDVEGVTQLAECRIVYPVVAGSSPAVLALSQVVWPACGPCG